MNQEKILFEQMQERIIRSQKRGIHFIIASVILWTGISIIRMLELPIMLQNMLTFCMSTPLMPIAYLMSKLLDIPFQDKENPLSVIGIILAVAQIPYLLIVMWIYSTMPEKMVMVYAVVTGAHFLPYGWYYKSKAYYIFAVLIPVISLFVGCNFHSITVAISMTMMELVLVIVLLVENRTHKVESEALYDGDRGCTQ